MMMAASTDRRLPLTALLSIALTASSCASRATDPALAGDSSTLAGTSWQLVKFEGGDDTVLTPDNPANYAIDFGADGRISVRFDCNRGTGTWKSSGSNQLELGSLALTQAACGPDSLHDHLVKQWPFIRSYVLEDGHLFLALMADGGIYEFRPTRRND